MRRIAETAGLDVDESPRRPDASSPQPVLFHLPAASPGALEEARALVRERAPGPVIVLAEECGHEGCSELRTLGLAGCLPLTSDPAVDARSLSERLSALEGGSEVACPHCPLVRGDGEGSLCTASRLEASRQDWTGHDARGVPCFPFVARSPSMLEVASMARRAATSDATILITGESGTGKEVLARYIHRQGNRARAPFVKVNCAALPDQLLESEVFGHEKGAFTGAEARKPGLFQTAEGGIILLDEISEVSLALQAKLLHVLEAKRFHRLGGLEEIAVDVQIIASTNRDLQDDVATGRFRKDLYFRLRVIELRLPPLRERRDDIPQLVSYFLCRLSRQHSRPIPALSPRLLKLVEKAPWTGNVRELENALRQVVILGEEAPLLGELFKGNGAARREAAAAEAQSEEALAPRDGLDLKEIAREAARNAERDAIVATLKETRWNRSRAAKRLGVSYKTLLTKMKDLLPPEP